MKRTILFFLVLGLTLAGCATTGSRRTSEPMEYFRWLPGSEFITQKNTGLVTVVMPNPSEGLWRRGSIFWGQAPINIIPDSRRIGGEMFNRRAIAEFRMGPASGRNWHNEISFPFPRNSSGIVWEQPERFWGSPVGQANIITFSTGSHSRSVNYYKQAPATGGNYPVGGVVYLPYVDPSGPSQLRLHYEWNPGAVIKEWLFRGGR